MKKMLVRMNLGVYYVEDGIRIEGVHDNIVGRTDGLVGDVTRIRGDVSYIRGDVSGLRGDVTGVCGGALGVHGNLDDCELTQEDRERKVFIVDLIR